MHVLFVSTKYSEWKIGIFVISVNFCMFMLLMYMYMYIFIIIHKY